MVARNDITGDKIISKNGNAAYSEGYDRIFGSKKIKPKANPQDWEEDFHLENGNYYNKCGVCGIQFVGYKRRQVCKLCYKPEVQNEKVPVDYCDGHMFRLCTPNCTSSDCERYQERGYQQTEPGAEVPNPGTSV